MSSGIDLRKRGQRREPPKRKHGYGRNGSPLDAIDAGDIGEVRISNDTLFALQHLYNTSPSIQAARAILMGQLLSSGVVVRRGGNDVELKDTFSRHLEDVWIPFARGVIDHFLMFGFVVVSLEEEEPPPFDNFLKGKKMASVSYTQKDPGDASAARARKVPVRDDVAHDINAPRARGTNLIPMIPDLGQYDVSFIHVGATNYRRVYRIFATNSENAYRQDFSSEIFFKTPPDNAGNICSPIATVFQSASFISSLEELALQAEVVRTRQLLVTQPMQRLQQNNNLDPANLFFDSESRAVQASSTSEEDASQAQSLAMQAKLMSIINRLQTTDPATGKSVAGSSSISAPSHVPPPLPPQLFACPEKQMVVPGVRPPEARSDLVDLMRVANDHIAATMGVPASVIFEGTLQPHLPTDAFVTTFRVASQENFRATA